MSPEDKHTMYWTGGIILAIVVVVAIIGYTAGWFNAAPGTP